MGATFTLWVLVHGFANLAGAVPSLDTSSFQALGAYASLADCEKVGNKMVRAFRAQEADVLWVCIPTGVHPR